MPSIQCDWKTCIHNQEKECMASCIALISVEVEDPDADSLLNCNNYVFDKNWIKKEKGDL